MHTIGVVGCGKSSTSHHFPAIRSLDRVEMKWVCDLDEELARQAGEELGVAHYSDASSAFQDVPDIININTPPFSHHDLAIDALKAGANVLVEKPIAMSEREIDEMNDTADEVGLKICGVHNNLFFDPVLSVRDAIERGEFGDIVTVQSFLGGSPGSHKDRDWVSDVLGGPIGDRLPHPIYLVTHFLDDVSDRSVSIHRDGEIKGVSIQINDGKRFGNIQVRQDAVPAKYVHVIGEKKRAEIDLFNYSKVVHRNIERTPVTMATENMKSSLQILGGVGVTGVDYLRNITTDGNKFKGPGHYNLIREFSRSISNDLPVPVPLDEGKKVLRVLEDVEDAR